MLFLTSTTAQFGYTNARHILPIHSGVNKNTVNYLVYVIQITLVISLETQPHHIHQHVYIHAKVNTQIYTHTPEDMIKTIIFMTCSGMETLIKGHRLSGISLKSSHKMDANLKG